MGTLGFRHSAWTGFSNDDLLAGRIHKTRHDFSCRTGDLCRSIRAGILAFVKTFESIAAFRFHGPPLWHVQPHAAK